jgi:hypothetical protein
MLTIGQAWRRLAESLLQNPAVQEAPPRSDEEGQPLVQWGLCAGVNRLYARNEITIENDIILRRQVWEFAAPLSVGDSRFWGRPIYLPVLDGHGDIWRADDVTPENAREAYRVRATYALLLAELAEGSPVTAEVV